MTGPDGAIVAIGLGNVLLRDDGVGVRVIEALGAVGAGDPGALPAGTRTLDGGTLGLDLLSALEGARAVLFVDAVDLGDAPGTVRVLHDDELTAAGGPRAGSGASRTTGLGELLAVACLLGRLPPAVALVGVQPGDIDLGLTLSAPVLAALPVAVEAARRELRALDARDPSGRPAAAHAAGLAGAIA
jgi:hydrogenase maturation protease